MANLASTSPAAQGRARARGWLPTRAEMAAATARTAAVIADPCASLADVERAAELEEAVLDAYAQQPEAQAELEAGYLMAALEQRVAALEAQVAQLRRAVIWSDAYADSQFDDGYRAGRASVLGAQDTPGRGSVCPRPRHLQLVSGGHR